MPTRTRVVCSGHPVVPGDLFARHQTITGLRKLADYLEANPAVPVEEFGTTYTVWINATSDDEGRAQIHHIAELLGAEVADWIAFGGYCTARRAFGRIRYTAVYKPARRNRWGLA
ncbi:hypothetical protein ABZ914_05655 [Spirillospora sp. NPDC046719]